MASTNIQKQKYKYFLVLDFEATCDNFCKIPTQEIIEFPVLKVDAESLEVLSTFHEYVKPRVHKTLTPFCTELTGITQDMVDIGKPFKEVLKLYNDWYKREVGSSKSLIITCGDWDLKTMLPSQCRLDSIKLPHHCFEWHNIKYSYKGIIGTNWKEIGTSMMTMLKVLNIEHVGRHHSGIDDCRNIANILISIIKQGIVIQPSGRVHNKYQDVM